MKHLRRAARPSLLALGLTVCLPGCAPSVRADLSHIQMVQAPGCTIPRIGEVSLGKVGALRSVPSMIDGHPVNLVLDTGSSDVAISAATAKRLDLPASQDGTMLISWGLGGFAKAKPVWTHDFEIAGFDMRNQKVGLAWLGPEDKDDTVDGLLGAGYLSAFDIDIDFARDRLTLYGSRHCTKGFVPWSMPFESVPMTLDPEGEIQVPVTIDGHPLTAMLDTGASLTVLTPTGARLLGLSAEALAHAPDVHVETADGRGATVRPHRFDRLDIGHQTWHQPVLAVQMSDRTHDVAQEALAARKLLGPEPVLILGVDFLKQYEVWISYGENQIFLAPVTPPKG